MSEEKESIIVADDDPATLIMFRKILEDRYDIRTCTNGMEVLEEFASKAADLILLDNNMPDMDGAKTIEALRQSSLSWNVPIIIISAHDDEQDIVAGLSVGADDYLVKPVKPAELLAKTQITLQKRKVQLDSQIKLGDVFNGKYKIDSELGEGGYSMVYKALNIRDNRTPWVALKIFDVPNIRRSNFMAHFLREAYEHSRLNNDNIVKLIDFGQVDQYYFLAMEYLDGITLADRISLGEPIMIDDLNDYTSQLGEALSCLEKNKLIHRDIKPSNIMLTVDDKLKLLDFGLAKSPGEETINLEDVFRGTPHYTSPEQILNDKSIDIRSDIYSVGISLFTAAAGRKPFDGDSHLNVMRKHLNEIPVPIESVRKDINPALARLINKCLEKKKENRPTVSEFQEVCQNLMQESKT
ncbi:MAG: protein kinase [Lentisphaeria bacterium]|nr:protein kinase [Lentisphaeria bacterium]NQZ68040.1 protein kinase [Lentisphaeria bacterium]